MKTKKLTCLAVAILATAVPQVIIAASITGNIGFSGAAQLDSTSVLTATRVVSWIDNTVRASSGDFASIAADTSVAMAANWNFNSGAVNNFWTVGGFTFNLASSTATLNGQFLDVALNGTVTGNGYSPTAFYGTFQTANPSANGDVVFTDRLSFAPISAPDGASTAMLLGLTCLGIACVNHRLRKA